MKEIRGSCGRGKGSVLGVILVFAHFFTSPSDGAVIRSRLGVWIERIKGLEFLLESPDLKSLLDDLDGEES